MNLCAMCNNSLGEIPRVSIFFFFSPPPRHKLGVVGRMSLKYKAETCVPLFFCLPYDIYKAAALLHSNLL